MFTPSSLKDHMGRGIEYHLQASQLTGREAQEDGYDLSQIGNMDETPVTFDMPGNRTVNASGSKTVLLKTTGHEKTRFTVVLGCMADGTKLKPLIIFKRKTLPKGVKFVPGVLVQAHPKGWMDEERTIDWLKRVWNNRPGALMRKRSLMVWDMFRGHLTDAVKRNSRELNTDMAVIPGGLTSVLQPLDVCINKPFKDRLRKLWNEWMISGAVTLTKGGNMQKPDITIVTSWMKEAWESLPPEIVKRSFLKCGISNAMDGSEDDALYKDTEESNESDDDTKDDADDDDADEYAEDDLTEEQISELFGESDDEEFLGF